MPGTGHSHRYKGSISNRNTKPAFQVLAPWNSTKNGEKGQVPISTGGTNLKFQKLDAQQMTNYDGNTFNMNNDFLVTGNNAVVGTSVVGGDLTATGTTTVENLFVNQDATYNKDLTVGGDFTVHGTTTTVHSMTTEIVDSIIKVSNAESDESSHKSFGQIFCFNSAPGGPIQEKTGFFGVQRRTPASFEIADVNFAIGGEANGEDAGVFTFLTQNVNNDPTGTLRDTNLSFDIPPENLGDALFMNLELYGNLTGHGDFNIQNIDNGGAVNIKSYGTKIETLDAGEIQLVSAGDISIVSNINLYLNAGGSHFKIKNTGAIDMGAVATVDLVSAGVMSLKSTENAQDAIKLHATVGGIDIDGGVGGDIDIKSNGASVHITSTEAVHDAITLDATAGGIDIESTDNSIDIKSNSANVNITSTASVANAIKLGRCCWWY